MTAAEREALIENTAMAICYAGIVPPIDYGGPEVYWRTVVPKRKELYRREARAALDVAEPAIRKDAIEKAKKCVSNAKNWVIHENDTSYGPSAARALDKLSEPS